MKIVSDLLVTESVLSRLKALLRYKIHRHSDFKMFSDGLGFIRVLLPKQKVASSSLVTRSIKTTEKRHFLGGFCFAFLVLLVTR